jgi:hypothetical protein
MARDWGFRGLLFDVSFDWVGDLCFNPLHEHDNPDQDPQCLADAMRESREQLVRQFGPDDVVFSGECQWDVATEFQDLTWDWATIGDQGSVEDHIVTEAFDMAFPRAKSCTKCTTERNQINRVFASGRLIEMYLEEGTGRLGDYPELTAYLQTLLAFKRRFVDCLARREAYLRDMFISLTPAQGIVARTHRHRDQALVMVANVSKSPISVQFTLDLGQMLGSAKQKLEAWSRELKHLSTTVAALSATLALDIPAEDFVGVHITAARD